MKFYLPIIALVTSAVSFNVIAIHVDMKPGLWETTVKMDPTEFAKMQKEALGDMADSVEKMMAEAKAKMTPEQLKQFESMMASVPAEASGSANGHELPAEAKNNLSELSNYMKTGLMTTKSCITQKEIDDINFSNENHQEGCVTKASQVSSAVFKTITDCKGDSNMHSEVEVTVLNSKSYNAKFVNNALVKNKKMVVHGEGFGKWLAADCGEYADEHKEHFGEEMNYDESDMEQMETKSKQKKSK